MNGNCKTVVHCTKHGCIPKTPTVDYKHELGNLLCRIHRDGGQYIQEHGWRKAIDDADAICEKMNAREDSRKADRNSYAGIFAWKDDKVASYQISKERMEVEAFKGQSLKYAADFCVKALIDER